MYANDITKITPPATLADLAALDATREVPYLKARCNRMGIHIPNPNPLPPEIIPYIERRLAEHNKRRAMFLSDRSGDYFEWKAIQEDLEQFISYLDSLNPVNLVNPLQNPSSEQADDTEPKSNHPGLKPNHPEPKPAQNRTDSEPKAAQNRTETEPKVENAAQAPANPPLPKSQNPKTPEPTEPAPETVQQYLVRLRDENPDMSIEQLQDLASKTLLPKPEESNLREYGSIYFDIYGPAKRVRIDKLSPYVQLQFIQMLEDFSLQRIQRQLMLPPPFGLYLIVSKSALRRFKIRYHASEAKRNRRALRQQIEALLTQPDLSDAEFARATDQLLKLRLLESGLKPDPDLTETKTLIDMLEKIRAGKIAERKIALAESKK
jgi:hypothetical protein